MFEDFHDEKRLSYVRIPENKVCQVEWDISGGKQNLVL